MKDQWQVKSNGGCGMSNAGKDSAEVVSFMALFNKLKLYSDDSPADLVDLAASDSSVKRVCEQLNFAAGNLDPQIRAASGFIVFPVNPAFQAAWRDYEKRYASVVSDAASAGEEISFPFEALTPFQNPDKRWNDADEEAAHQVSRIEEAMEFVQLSADEVAQDNPSDGDFLRAIDALRYLEQDTGLDLRGVFRRRALVPFFLVPRHVASKYGSEEKLSMLKNLEQAHDAFVFGAPHAALALMRSTMEAVLRNHYLAEGAVIVVRKGKGFLEELINKVDHLLPRDANANKLHCLRKLANEALHLDKKSGAKIPKLGSGLIDHIQKMTMAAIAMADMKVCAQRS
jgi:hypothetical protein